MKFGFKFSNLCGVVYKQGNVLFTSDGNNLLSPIGNRITVFDLVNHTSSTLPFENRKNITRLALSPNDHLLISVDEEGFALLINFFKRIVLAHFNFKDIVRSIAFSPDGKYFAVTHKRGVQVWHTPSTHKEFAPFILHRAYVGHYDHITSIDWSPDSQFFLTSSRDCTARLWSLESLDPKEFVPVTLTCHRDFVISAFFSSTGQEILTVGRDGMLLIWNRQEVQPVSVLPQIEGEKAEGEGEGEGEGKLVLKTRIRPRAWKIESRHFFKTGKVASASFNKRSGLLVIGFQKGNFGLYDVFPDFTPLQTMTVGQQKLSSVTLNPSGQWLAIGCANLGQLLVWEWQSETYILKQSGHETGMSAIAYSGDGSLIATGGDDGKIRLWNATSGLCFVTFTDHTAPISQLVFSPAVGTHVLFSAALDGTARAFDLVRYRNFRTFIPPPPMPRVQFSSLAVDPSGEVLCTGTMSGAFDIYVWSVQTGKLLDVLSGHSGPVCSLAFSPTAPTLVSASWDHSSRLWDVFNTKTSTENLSHASDVLCVAYRPDGREVCTASLDGLLQFWDPVEGVLKLTIEGRKDIMGGRKIRDVRTAKNSTSSKHFTSVCYSADGKCVLAGGNSKYVCIYEVSQRILLKKFQVSHNRSLDGVLDFLNSRSMTEAGPIELIDEEVSDGEDDKPKKGTSLPGVQKGNLSTRKTRPAVRVTSIQFSPTGRAWAAASTEGLLIYSLDESSTFDPYELDIDITPENTRITLAKKEFLKALVMSFRLNERELIKEVYEEIPPGDIQLLSRELPFVYVPKLLSFISSHMEKSPHLEFHLLWVLHLCNQHGNALRGNGNMQSTFRNLQKNLTGQFSDLQRVCTDNLYTLEYFSALTPLVEKESALLLAQQGMGLVRKKTEDEDQMDLILDTCTDGGDTGDLPGWGGDFVEPDEEENGDVELDNDNISFFSSSSSSTAKKVVDPKKVKKEKKAAAPTLTSSKKTVKKRSRSEH